MPVFAPKPIAGTGLTGSTTYNSADVGYDIVPVMGQSNAAGEGVGFDLSHFDPVVDRIDTWNLTGTYSGLITKAAEPLSLAGADGAARSTAQGMGPGLPFAREYIKTVPSNRSVLLVPCAYGGTPFEGADSNAGSKRWKVGDGTASPNMFDQAITQTLAAKAAADAAFPGTTNRVVGFLWVHGEQDSTNGTSFATYSTDFDALLAAFRAQLSVPNAWAILGQMNPTYWTTLATNSANKACYGAEGRNTLCSFAYAPTMDSDPTNGTVHFSAAAQRILGKRMFQQLAYAKANVTGAGPTPVTAASIVQATSTTATVTITRSPGRVINYVVKWSVDGGATWTNTSRTLDLSLTQAITGLTSGQTVQAQVFKANELGTSAPVLSNVITMAAPQLPNAPTSLAVGTPVTSTIVPLNWTASAVDGTNDAAATYTIEKSTDSGSTWSTATSGIAATSGSATGLTASTSYQFRVKAVNTAGTSAAASNVVTQSTNSAPSGFVSDSFTDTAGLSLVSHAGELGATWTKHLSTSGGSAAITTAGRVRNSAATATGFFASGTPGSADYTVEGDMVFVTLLTGTSCALLGRIITAGSTVTAYGARYVVSSNVFQLVKYVTGTATVLGTPFSSTPTANQSIHVKLVMAGTSLSVVIDGTTQISATDSAVTAAGGAGFIDTGSTSSSDSTGIHIDNFAAG